MPKYSGLRILTASLLGVAAFTFTAQADEPKPAAPHAAAPSHPGAPPPGARPPAGPGAVPPGMHPPGGAGAPGGRGPGMPAAAPGGRPGDFHGGPGDHGGFRGGPGDHGPGFRGGPRGPGPAHFDFRGRDFHHFSVDEQRVWAGGGWHHDWHDGRFGWWWYTDGGWYFYDQPVYPMPLVVSDDYVPDPDAGGDAPPEEDPGYYPQPGPPQGMAPPQYWYYCDNPAGYYPYVQSCPTQFRPVPATPPQQ